MFGLLIVIAAAAIGAVAAVILVVAWAIRREDSCLTMVDPAPGRAAHFARRLLGLHAIGMAAPGEDQHRVRGNGSAAWPDGDPGDLPADWPGPRGPGPGRWDTLAGV
jgi:hypothetical protein